MSQSRLELVVGEHANKLLSTKSFIKKWLHLYEHCSYATVFQHPVFVLPWYDVYAPEWQPVLIIGWDANEQLEGLWLLAYCTENHALVNAGDLEAEYQTWLAVNKEAEFVAKACNILKSQFKFSIFKFIYLPDMNNLTILKSITEIKKTALINRCVRPIWLLDKDHVDNSLKKKKNKYRVAKLKEQGDMRFVRITKLDELEQVFDLLIDFFDLRKAAKNHTTPFRKDPKKALFFKKLLQNAEDKLCITITFLDEQPIAATFGMSTGSVFHLGLICHSPFYAEYSPGKLHLLLLGQYLFSQGYTQLDFTPGGDFWKERFASTHEEVAEVLIYKSSLRYLARICMIQFKKVIKHIVPFNLKINKKLKSIGSLQLKSRMSNLLKWTAESREYRIYRFNDVSHLDNRFKRNSLADLFLFDASKNWTTYDEFLSESLQRLEAGDLVYTVTCDNVLAFYMWLKTKDVNSYTAESVSPLFVIPEGGMYLYDAYCHPDYRGKGFYQTALAHIKEDNKSAELYGYILATNNIPTHVAQRLGVHEYTVHWQKRFGRIKTWTS